jgi:hypothetical protein
VNIPPRKVEGSYTYTLRGGTWRDLSYKSYRCKILPYLNEQI